MHVATILLAVRVYRELRAGDGLVATMVGPLPQHRRADRCSSVTLCPPPRCNRLA